VKRCDCVAKVSKAVKEQNGDEASIKLDLLRDGKTGEIYPWFQGIGFTYKNGKRTLKGTLLHTYCPVCGTQLREDK